MAKHGKALPLRRQREGVEDALLIRSVESLGRMIGSLQRQLEESSRKGHGARSTADRKSKRAAKSAAAGKTTGRSRSGASRKTSKSSRRR